MNKNTSLILRISGLFFFAISLIFILEVVNVNFSYLMSVISESNSTFINVLLILQTFLYNSAFLFGLFASGTALLYGGKNNWTQAVWNCQIYHVFFQGLFTSIQTFIGFSGDPDPEGHLFLYSNTIIMGIVFAIILFFCLREDENFSWKKLLPKDANSKMCIKIYFIMLVMIYFADLILINKFGDQ